MAIYSNQSLNAKLFNALNGSEFEESLWCKFDNLKNKDFITMYLQMSEQHETIIFSMLPLANKSMNNIDKICIM